MNVKKLFFLFTLAIMSLSMSVGAGAVSYEEISKNEDTIKIISNQVITPRWQNTDSVKAVLSFTGTKANVYTRVLGKLGTTKITATVTLQRVNTGGLTTIKTWSGLETLGEELVYEDSYYVTRGYTYRLTINAKVYKDGSYESVSVYDETYCE